MDAYLHFTEDPLSITSSILAGNHLPLSQSPQLSPYPYFSLPPSTATPPCPLQPPSSLYPSPQPTILARIKQHILKRTLTSFSITFLLYSNSCSYSLTLTVHSMSGHRVWTSEIYVSKLLLRHGICLVHDNRFQGIIARPVTHNFNSHDVVDNVNRVNDTNGSWR